MAKWSQFDCGWPLAKYNNSWKIDEKKEQTESQLHVEQDFRIEMAVECVWHILCSLYLHTFILQEKCSYQTYKVLWIDCNVIHQYEIVCLDVCACAHACSLAVTSIHTHTHRYTHNKMYVFVYIRRKWHCAWKMDEWSGSIDDWMT